MSRHLAPGKVTAGLLRLGGPCGAHDASLPRLPAPPLSFSDIQGDVETAQVQGGVLTVVWDSSWGSGSALSYRVYTAKAGRHLRL